MADEITPLENQTKAAGDFFDSLDTELGIKKTDNNITEEEKQKAEAEKLKQKSISTAPSSEPKKEKPTKEESVAAIKKQLEAEKERNKKFTETFGEDDPEVIKEVFDYIKENVEGPVTKEMVKERLEAIKQSNLEIEELKGKLTSKEEAISQLDVRESDVFKKQFQQPYEDAANNLFVEFANYDNDGKIIAEGESRAFWNFLMKNPDIDAPVMKSQMIAFAKSYKEKTGEDPTLPGIGALMTSLRTFKGKQEEMGNAYKNWAAEKKTAIEKAKLKSEQDAEFNQTRNKKQRKDLMTKAYRGFERPEVIEDSKIQELFQDEHKFMENIFDGTEVPPHDQLMQRGVKARLYDQILPEYLELKKLKDELDDGERNGFTGSGGKKRETSGVGKGDDWGGGVL